MRVSSQTNRINNHVVNIQENFVELVPKYGLTGFEVKCADADVPEARDQAKDGSSRRSELDQACSQYTDAPFGNCSALSGKKIGGWTSVKCLEGIHPAWLHR